MPSPAQPTRRRRAAVVLSTTVLAASTLLATGPLLVGAASADPATATGTNTPGIDPGTYSCGGSYSYGFEDLDNLTDIGGTTVGPLTFSTLQGGPWVIADFGTANYNGYYAHQGSKVSYLTEDNAAAAGRIDFAEPVSSFSLLTATGQGGIVLEAYDESDDLLASAGPAAANTQTGTLEELAVSSTAGDIDHVVVHDHGNYFLVDSLCVDGEGPSVQPQSITFDSSAPNDAVVGSTYQVSATGGGSGNPVTFSIPAASAGVCTVDGSGLVGFTHPGTCTVAADQAGNDDYAAAPTATQDVTVGKAAQSVTFTSTPASHVVVGSTYRPTATGGASGIPVTLGVAPASARICTIDASGLVTFRRAGTCTLTADQAGNSDYLAAPTASQQVSVSTQKANQAITFTSAPPSPGRVGTTYQATAQGGGSSSPVVFSAKSTSAKVCTVTPDGTVAFLRPGNCVVYATQAGDAGYRPAPRVQQTVKVVR